MTNKKAIRVLENIERYITTHANESCEEEHTALTLAIKALEERPKGKWIIGETYDCHSDIVKTYTCPFCGKKEYSNYPFCHCGADMRGDV